MSRNIAGPLSDRPLFGWSRTRIAKAFTAASLLGAAAGFLALCTVQAGSLAHDGLQGCTLYLLLQRSTAEWVAVGLMTGTMFMITLDTGGFLKSPLYMGPEHAAVVNSAAYWTATLAAATEIAFIGWETADFVAHEWAVVFASCAGSFSFPSISLLLLWQGSPIPCLDSGGMCVAAAAVFLVFGSAERQPWAGPQPQARSTKAFPTSPTRTDSASCLSYTPLQESASVARF